LARASKFETWPKAKLRFFPPKGISRLWIALVIVLFTLTECEQSMAQVSPANLPNLRFYANGEVNAIVEQPDGKVIIGGAFDDVNGVAKRCLARLHRDGSLDLTWNLDVDGRVVALALEGNNLYIGGFFDKVGGLSRRGLAKVSTIGGGEVDLEWIPFGSGDVVGGVDAIVVSGGDVFVGGNFNAIGGATRINLAKLSSQGTGLADQNWQADCPGGVNALSLQSSNLFVGGTFDSIGGTMRSSLAKVSRYGLGKVDHLWNPGLSGDFVQVTALAHSGTHLVVGGVFNLSGTSLSNLVKITVEGTASPDNAWQPHTGPFPEIGAILVEDTEHIYVGGGFELNHGRVTRLVGPRAESDTNWSAAIGPWRVNALMKGADGLYVGGKFSHVEGELTSAIARLDPILGRLDERFAAQVHLPGEVRAIVRQPDGKLVLGGDFIEVDGHKRGYLVRLNSDGTVDDNWNPNANARVLAMTANASSLFVSGFFTEIGNVSQSVLAKVDLIGSDKVDPFWRPEIGNVDDVSVVFTLALTDDSLFIGGPFQHVEGQIRAGLAKLDTVDGQLDLRWSANVSDQNGYPWVYAILIHETNLIVGGAFASIKGSSKTNLAKVSTRGSGIVNAVWNPNPKHSEGLGGIGSLAVSGTNLYVGGGFSSIGGIRRSNLARVDLLGSGRCDISWNPSLPADFYPSSIGSGASGTYISGSDYGRIETVFRLDDSGNQVDDWSVPPNSSGGESVYDISVSDNGAYVVGSFGTLGIANGPGELRRNGIAFLAVAGAPVLSRETNGLIVILRNAVNGQEVTHFRITGITDGSLWDPDGTHRLEIGDFVTVAAGALGLKFIANGPNGGIAAVSALNQTPGGAGALESRIEWSAPSVPIFSFETNRLEATEGPGIIRATVRKRGLGAGSVLVSTLGITAKHGTDIDQLPSQLLQFSAEQFTRDVFVQMINNSEVESDEVFAIRLHDPSAGATLANPAEVIVTIVDDDNCIGISQTTTSLPTELQLPARGSLQVTLDQPLGQWRLVGEPYWHDSGAVVQGLHQSSSYRVEFKPLPNLQAPTTRSIFIYSGTNTTLQEFYVPLASARGHLSILLEPEEILAGNLPGAWKLQGESNWHLSGEVMSNLNVGTYIVEFRDVPAVPTRTKPRPQRAEVGPIHIYEKKVVYPQSGGLTGSEPVALNASDATSTEPYLHSGQIDADGQFGSGVVVGPRTVLTAAHVVFDDQELRYVNSDSLRWFHRRHRDVNEPPPQTPRGCYIFTGYADQRIRDNSPDISSPASQQLDAAVLYFLGTPFGPNLPGAGGYGGYLVSEGQTNWLLTSNNKMLVGYPLDGVTPENQGRLHATAPADLSFTPLYGGVYETSSIRGRGGNSGGPLYVELAGRYYPAGIYLGGFNRTLVKAIDCRVADLIARAEAAANGDGNSHGGGVTFFSSGSTVSAFDPAYITVLIEPAEAAASGGGWQIADVDSASEFRLGASNTVALVGLGSIRLKFRPIPGFAIPQVGNVELPNAQNVKVIASYGAPRLQLSFHTTGTLTLIGQVGTNYLIQESSNLPFGPWSPFTNVQLNSYTQSFLIPFPTGAVSRFYRAIALP